MPHEHAILGREGPESARIRRIWLFIIAITLHNFPEGIVVGVGFGGDEIIPEPHRDDYRTLATFLLLAGFVVMMFLDATLG